MRGSGLSGGSRGVAGLIVFDPKRTMRRRAFGAACRQCVRQIQLKTINGSIVSVPTLQPFNWFNPAFAISCLSVCIAIAAFVVAFWNFRLSRFPHVRLRVHCHYSMNERAPKGDYFLDVEVENWGLPIYDLKVAIEAEYMPGEAPWAHFSAGLDSIGTLPNPVNPGQVGRSAAHKKMALRQVPYLLCLSAAAARRPRDGFGCL